MKTKMVILSVLLTAIIAIARIIGPFPGWERLEGRSPCIVIGRCGSPTPPTPGVIIEDATTSDSGFEIISILKGSNYVSSARLQTDRTIWPGEVYLAIGFYDSGTVEAYEDYRVIPLGLRFSTNSIAGKPLDEQLQILFKQRVADLNGEIQTDAAEKQRLEEGIKK